MNKKALLAGSMVFLFIGVALSPVSANNTTEDILYQETTAIDTFMEKVERIASESHTFSDFVERLQELCQNDELSKFPVVRELVSKILSKLLKEDGLSIAGFNLDDLLEKLSLKSRPDYFVISFGAYHRLSPRKENSINRFKERLSMWRYSDASKLLKGRTLILERQPFGIHQKMIGPQIGIMKGFRGIYIDIESKLTGNAYVVFLGSVHRIRAFDLTPLSK
jgi:hypothetical protein